ncbi:hypothetical protein A6U87_15020 [Rhizobium sp. AC44/96]|nr:hypothetical protein A6U87_15020 [Rhizobium sp. AC44/96]
MITMLDLEVAAREFLDWWSEHRSSTFSLTEVAVKINGGRGFNDFETATLRAFFNENADPIETIGNVVQRWAAIQD